MAGVRFLRDHLPASAWIAGLVVVAHVLYAAGTTAFRLKPAPWSFVVVMGGGAAAALLSFLSFAAASRALLGR